MKAGCRFLAAHLCMFLCFSCVSLAEQQRGRPEPEARLLKSDIDVVKLASGIALATLPPTFLVVTIDDTVAYVGDVPYEKLQSSLALSFSIPKPLSSVVAIGDIRKIDDRAAKGTYINVAFPLFITPNPSPETGVSIADTTRIASVAQSFEILRADGTPIGSIFGYGFAFGPPMPGAPKNGGGGGIAIIGGTGPYVAMRGQMFTTVDTSPFANPPSVRFASGEESTALRRVNKGGVTKFVLELHPAFPAEALSLEDGRVAVFTPRTRAS